MQNKRYAQLIGISAINLLLIAALGGCSKSECDTVPIKGRVTFAGQAPPSWGKVTFAPVEAAGGLPRRPGTGEFDASGEFSVTTFAPNDGLVPGRYTANIACWREKPTLETAASASYVAPTFHPEVTIDANGPRPATVEIDVPATSIQNSPSAERRP